MNAMNAPQPSFLPSLDFSRREVVCFLVAAAIHSLLFLWKGGMLSFPDAQAGGMGEVLTGVDFLAEVPNYDAGGGGAVQAKPQGILARMKSMITNQTDLALGGKTDKAEIPSSQPSRAETLTSKEFADRSGFEGLMDRTSDLQIAKGTSKEVVVQPSIGNFSEAKPNLKQSAFKVAKKDVAFPIVSASNRDALVNVNAVPVAVGRVTSPRVKSFDGGPGTGAALESKEFAPRGGKTSGGFAGAGLAGSAGGGTSGKAGLAMGGSASSISTGAGLAGSGTGSGAGSGSGSGAGAGTGKGYGNGSGSGRAWGSGSGAGFGSGSGTPMAALSRNTVRAPAGMKSDKDSDFSITGALARRPVLQKQLPPYSMDARVALRFRVDWSGRVLDGILVEISSGNPSFDRQVMAALKNWLFSKLPADRSNEIQEGVVSFRFKGV